MRRAGATHRTHIGLMVTIRQEESGDTAAIRRVVQEAFGGSAEADLIDALRTNGKFRLSLVAIREGQVAGHLLFTEVTIENSSPSLNALGLAPLAVKTEFQRQGVGSALMRHGLAQCRDMGYGAVIVLGHSQYYPKFGFLPANRYGLRCEYEVPDDVFMALELRAGALLGIGGWYAISRNS